MSKDKERDTFTSWPDRGEIFGAGRGGSGRKNFGADRGEKISGRGGANRGGAEIFRGGADRGGLTFFGAGRGGAAWFSIRKK